jgi:hypothetical protein
MNWTTFLLNQFLIDCEEVQDKGTKFHCSWILIIIILLAWREPDDNQFLGIKAKPLLATHYQNLWYTTDKACQMDTNFAFYIYMEMIRDNIYQTPCILPQVVEIYKIVAHFKARRHHMYA